MEEDYCKLDEESTKKMESDARKIDDLLAKNKSLNS